MPASETATSAATAHATPPHLKWRVPAHFVDLYPAANVSLPSQRTLDNSIWGGAYTVFPMNANVGGADRSDFVHTPYESGNDAQLRQLGC